MVVVGVVVVVAAVVVDIVIAVAAAVLPYKIRIRKKPSSTKQILTQVVIYQSRNFFPDYCFYGDTRETFLNGSSCADVRDRLKRLCYEDYYEQRCCQTCATIKDERYPSNSYRGWNARVLHIKEIKQQKTKQNKINK